MLAGAAETAAITGEFKSQINRHIARAEALSDDMEVRLVQHLTASARRH